MKYKILNLYACLGGNRYKWDDVADIEVTAVELDPVLAELYKKRFPKDRVIITDAHQYLLNHFKEYDIIWASPPCPSHSRMAYGCRKSDKSNHSPCFPDMTLYEEIILLSYYFKGKYIVENVIPYYVPLIPGKKRGRHIYWTNFPLPKILSNRISVTMGCKDEIKKWAVFHDYDFTQYKGKQRKDKIARNLVDYEAGKTILYSALNKIRQTDSLSKTLFNQKCKV